MRCSRCGKCCEKTEMLLSEADIKHLKKLGYGENNFVVYDEDGYAKLRNIREHCVFYDVEKRLCKVYKYRPLGCRIYPVVFVEGKGVVVDNLCPSKHTVSTAERQRKGKILRKLLERIDEEAERRVLHKSIKKA